MRTKLYLPVFSFIVISIAATSYAKTVTYDFKDPKGVNAVSIIVDSKFEPNVGSADNISGMVTIDHDAKKILKGSFSIPANEVTMTNSMMTKVLHSKEWLDTEQHPAITFAFQKTISVAKMSESEFDLSVNGYMTIKGVTKLITAPVRLSFFPGKLGVRNKGAKGDIAVLRTTFKIDRFEFQIKPDMPKEILGEKIRLTVNIAGGAAQ